MALFAGGMVADLLHGLRHEAARVPRRAGDGAGRPRMVVFDSGLGGLTVLSEIVKARPEADLLYVADDAAFPYGRLSEEGLVARVIRVMDEAVTLHAPQAVVIACNTASTLVLEPLRARFPDIAFIGVVPAVKPAAQASRSGVISVLATPGTVKRDYTRRLVEEYARHCEVTLVGSLRLASLAEGVMRGERVSDEAIRAEIEPCFVGQGARRTDAVVLACTHYPLLTDRFRQLAPWPVAWIDPAPAIARRVVELLGPAAAAGSGAAPRRACFTSGAAPGPDLRRMLGGRGLAVAPLMAIPFSGR